MTKSSGPLRGADTAGAGSGVASKARLAVYSLSDAGAAARGRLAFLPFKRDTVATANLESQTYADVNGNERVFLQGMAWPLLSGEAACERDAALLRGALRDGRDQQHLLPHARRGHARGLGERGARSFQLHAQSAAAHHPRQ